MAAWIVERLKAPPQLDDIQTKPAGDRAQVTAAAPEAGPSRALILLPEAERSTRSRPGTRRDRPAGRTIASSRCSARAAWAWSSRPRTRSSTRRGRPEGHAARGLADQNLAPAALPPRGPGDGRPRARQHRHHLPGRRGPRRRLPGHASSCRARPLRALAGAGPASRRLPQVLRMGREIARGLAAAHEHGPDPPRHQAGQHLAGSADRPGQDPRLRPGPRHRAATSCT